MTISKSSVVPGVFISHRCADADLARRLAEELQKADYNSSLDEWEILVGDSVVERINAGLQTAKYVIVCHSEAGVLSNWMRHEWMPGLARQMDGHRTLPPPIRTPVWCNTSPILADIRYADLVKEGDRASASTRG
jgi:hypothetical protein